MASATATGQYPNLAAAVAASGPSRPRDADEVFDSCVSPLIDIALAGRLDLAPARPQGRT
jgi:hypothetical protein